MTSDSKVIHGLKNPAIEKFLIFYQARIKDAMQRMSHVGEKVLFVVDEEAKLLGALTDGDIRSWILADGQLSDGVLKICAKNPYFVSQGASSEVIKDLMLEHRIEGIPVLDAEGRVADVCVWDQVFGGKRMRAMTRTTAVVIMAGGRGTRLDPFTKILPKPLIPLGNKPVIQHIMDRFREYGFSKFLYTLNYKKEYLKIFLSELQTSYSIDWAEEETYLGTAGSLSLLKEQLTETFFVTNCDSLLETNLEEIYRWHREQNAMITVVGCHNEVTIPFGVLRTAQTELVEISEKPVQDVLINTGIYVMEPSVLKYIPKDKPLDMNELLTQVTGKEKVCVYPIYNGWLDIGQWERFNEAAKILEKEN